MSETLDEPLYPLFLRLEGWDVLVVGGGAVALRKAQALRAAGARVRVVAPKVHPGLRSLSREGAVELTARPFEDGDIRGARLVFAATDEPALNARVAGQARDRGVPVNVADEPDLCDFFVPSRMRRGPVSVAVSSGGACPALAVHVRKVVEAAVGTEFGVFARDLARVRDELRRRFPGDQARRARVLRDLAASDWRERLAAGDREGYRRLLEAWKSQP